MYLKRNCQVASPIIGLVLLSVLSCQNRATEGEVAATPPSPASAPVNGKDRSEVMSGRPPQSTEPSFPEMFADQISILPHIHRDEDGIAACPSFSHDGGRLAYGKDNQLIVKNAYTFSTIRSYSVIARDPASEQLNEVAHTRRFGHKVTAVAWSPDGDRLMFSTSENESIVKVLTIDTGAVVELNLGTSIGTPQHLAWTSERTLYSVAGFWSLDRPRVTVVDLDELKVTDYFSKAGISAAEPSVKLSAAADLVGSWQLHKICRVRRVYTKFSHTALLILENIDPQPQKRISLQIDTIEENPHGRMEHYAVAPDLSHVAVFTRNASPLEPPKIRVLHLGVDKTRFAACRVVYQGDARSHQMALFAQAAATGNLVASVHAPRVNPLNGKTVGPDLQEPRAIVRVIPTESEYGVVHAIHVLGRLKEGDVLSGIQVLPEPDLPLWDQPGLEGTIFGRSSDILAGIQPARQDIGAWGIVHPATEADEKTVTAFYAAFTALTKPSDPPESPVSMQPTSQQTQQIPDVVRQDYESCQRAQATLGGCLDLLRQIHQSRLPQWKSAAERGSAQAMWLIGMCHQAELVEDRNAAVQWFQSGAGLGDPASMCSLATWHVVSASESQDPRAALQWLRKAVDLDYAPAMAMLGTLYLHGRGVRADAAEAQRWLGRAAEKGDSNAMLRLGQMFALGRGVAPDDEKAVEWHRKSAEAGNVLATYLMGSIYENGQGVLPNQAKAVEWYVKAADLGSKEAQKKLVELGVSWEPPSSTTQSFQDQPERGSRLSGSPRVALEIGRDGEEWGTIVLELLPEQAPITVQNFLKYVDEGYYNGTIFHRVISDFMIQGGGFSAMGTPKKEGLHDPIKNESPQTLPNTRGTIAMARSGPHTATSQFFINVKDNPLLNHPSRTDQWGYAVFGKVVEGMYVVDRIRAVEVVKVSDRGELSQPRNPPVLTTARRVQ